MIGVRFAAQGEGELQFQAVRHQRAHPYPNSEEYCQVQDDRDRGQGQVPP